MRAEGGTVHQHVICFLRYSAANTDVPTTVETTGECPNASKTRLHRDVVASYFVFCGGRSFEKLGFAVRKASLENVLPATLIDSDQGKTVSAGLEPV